MIACLLKLFMAILVKLIFYIFFLITFPFRPLVKSSCPFLTEVLSTYIQVPQSRLHDLQYSLDC